MLWATHFYLVFPTCVVILMSFGHNLITFFRHRYSKPLAYVPVANEHRASIGWGVVVEAGWWNNVGPSRDGFFGR